MASSLDVGLPDATEDEAYLAVLRPNLERALAEVRADMAFYLARADPHVNDRLGRLALTKAGLAGRDRMVLTAVHQAGLPLVVMMAGGYGRDVHETGDLYLQTMMLALDGG